MISPSLVRKYYDFKEDLGDLDFSNPYGDQNILDRRFHVNSDYKRTNRHLTIEEFQKLEGELFIRNETSNKKDREEELLDMAQCLSNLCNDHIEVPEIKRIEQEEILESARKEYSIVFNHGSSYKLTLDEGSNVEKLDLISVFNSELKERKSDKQLYEISFEDNLVPPNTKEGFLLSNWRKGSKVIFKTPSNAKMIKNDLKKVKIPEKYWPDNLERKKTQINLEKPDRSTTSPQKD